VNKRSGYFIVEFEVHDLILTTAVGAHLTSFDEMPTIIADDKFPELDTLLFYRAEPSDERNRFNHIIESLVMKDDVQVGGDAEKMISAGRYCERRKCVSPMGDCPL
jgi:hypothetical protein